MDLLGRLSAYTSKERSPESKHAIELNLMNCRSVAEARLFAGPGDLYLASRPKGLYSSKKDNGSVLIIGGSESFHGAPAMASNAAYSTLASLRVGAGYAMTYVPKGITGAVRSLSPNLIVRSMHGERLGVDDLEAIESAAGRADSVVIGPGIGRSSESLDAAASLISSILRAGKRVIADADAIYAIGLTRLRHGRNLILTPHDREFLGLTGIRLRKRDTVQRAHSAIKAARRLGGSMAWRIRPRQLRRMQELWCSLRSGGNRTVRIWGMCALNPMCTANVTISRLRPTAG